MYNKAKTSRAVRRKRKKQEYAMRRLVVLSMLVLLIFTVLPCIKLLPTKGKTGPVNLFIPIPLLHRT